MTDDALKRWRSCRKARCIHDLDYENEALPCPEGHWDQTAAEEIPEASEETIAPLSSLSKITSFIGANIKEAQAIIHGEAPVSAEDVARRLEICRGCEEYDDDRETCKRCGCFMRWKTAYRSTSCPLGKW